MKTLFRNVIAGVALAAAGSVATVALRGSPPAVPNGFKLNVVGVDTGSRDPTPTTLPAAWKLVGVAGDGSNGSILWFDDEEGSLYAVAGFLDADTGEFILRKVLNKVVRR